MCEAVEKEAITWDVIKEKKIFYVNFSLSLARLSLDRKKGSHMFQIIASYISFLDVSESIPLMDVSALMTIFPSTRNALAHSLAAAVRLN